MIAQDINLHARRWLEANGIPLPDPWEPKDIPIRIEQFYPGGRAAFLASGIRRPKLHADKPSAAERARARKAANSRRYYRRHKETVLAAKRCYYEKHKRKISFQKHDYYERTHLESD